MFTLTKEFTFEAAHQLPHHDGKCARLHGHSWRMRVVVRDADLYQSGPKVGMVMDYADISKWVKPIVEERLDHHFLNQTLELENPTSEEVARWVYKYLRAQGLNVFAVEVDETCTSSCRYEPL